MNHSMHRDAMITFPETRSQSSFNSTVIKYTTLIRILFTPINSAAKPANSSTGLSANNIHKMPTTTTTTSKTNRNPDDGAVSSGFQSAPASPSMRIKMDVFLINMHASALIHLLCSLPFRGWGWGDGGAVGRPGFAVVHYFQPCHVLTVKRARARAPRKACLEFRKSSRRNYARASRELYFAQRSTFANVICAVRKLARERSTGCGGGGAAFSEINQSWLDALRGGVGGSSGALINACA